VTAGHPPRLRQAIESAGGAGAEVMVIDTGPREGGGAAEAARLADLVVIPCRPTAVDLAAVPTTMATVAGSEAVVVLNGCPPRGQWTVAGHGGAARHWRGGVSDDARLSRGPCQGVHGRSYRAGTRNHDPWPQRRQRIKRERERERGEDEQEGGDVDGVHDGDGRGA